MLCEGIVKSGSCTELCNCDLNKVPPMERFTHNGHNLCGGCMNNLKYDGIKKMWIIVLRNNNYFNNGFDEYDYELKYKQLKVR